MNIEALFKHNAFSQLMPEQLQLLKQFAKDIQGRGTADIARMYMQLNQRISQIKPITTAQRNAIIEAIRGFVPEGDKQKLNGFLKMLGR